MPTKIISKWCWQLARLKRNDKRMKKNKITGWIGTLVLHAVLLLLLSLIAISKPKAQEEGGISVMLGSADVAQGSLEPYTMTEVDVLREPQLPTEVQSSTPIPEPVKEPDDVLLQIPI